MLKEGNWIGYTRELDIYSARFRHSSELLEFGEEITRKHCFESKLDQKELLKYIGEGGNAKIATARLKAMRRKPMTAARIDEIKDEADKRLKGKEKNGGEENRITVSEAYRTKEEALKLYSNFVRNIEFADVEEKRTHLGRVIARWAVFMQGLYESIKAVFEEIGSSDQITELDEEIIVEVQSFVKSVVPTLVASICYVEVGTEKLLGLLEEVATNSEKDILHRMIALFVMLDVEPRRGLTVMRSEPWKKLVREQWIAEAMEGRLYRHYLERPLPDDVREDFIRVASELEALLSGVKSKEATGHLIQRMKQGALKRKARGES